MQKSLYLALILCAALLLFLTPASTRADSVPGDATLVLNASTVTTLTGTGLSLSPLGQASFSASNMTLMFPITSGTIGPAGDTFSFDGSGFSLAGGSTTATFRNFVINTSTDTLTGNIHFGNTQLNGVTLFDIGNGGVLTLDAQAAAALSTAFGTSNLTGKTFGTASITVPLSSSSSSGTGEPSGTTPTPEPSSLGLLASSALLIGVAALIRSRNRTQIHSQFDSREAEA